MNRVLGRFIAASVLATSLALVPAGGVLAGGDATSPAALGCDDPRVEYDLKHAGDKQPDIGALKVYERQNEGLNRWCVITKSGSATLGKNKPMSIMLAWHEPGEKIVWPSSQGSSYDAGTFRNYAGSAYATGQDGKCLAIKGYVVWHGKTYKRTIRDVYCYE